MESSVPPGFRFHPNDEELVGYYLKKKVASQKIDLDVIREIDLYRIEPWDIQERCRIGYEEQNEWYFFSHKDKKYPTGTRTNRATMAGFWKATGRDKAVYDKSTKLIGMRKTLVFYKGRAPNGQKTDWIMHEYRLESDENGPPQEEGWVVCRAFKKRITNVNVGSSCKLTDQVWDSSSTYNYTFYQQTSGLSSSSHHHPHLPPRSFLPPPPPLLSSSSSSSHSFLCKQELDHSTTPTTTLINNHSHNMMMMNNLNNILSTNSDLHPFLQLPQLESPSVPPLLKSSISTVQSIQEELQTDNNNEETAGEIIEDTDKGHLSSVPLVAEKVTDWRSLDKFVASQLSHDNDKGDDRSDQGAVSSFGGHGNERSLFDMALLLLQNSGKDGGGGDKFINGLLADLTN